MRKKTINIYDVARQAGVSATAVSFAFNNPSEIGTETAERIRLVARQLGYSPSPLARAMASQRTNVIGFLVPSTITFAFTNPFISSFLEGVGIVCDAHSLNLLVVSPYKGSLEEATRRAPVDAYIVLGVNENHDDIAPLRRRGVPFVVVDGDAETVSSINVNNECGAHAAAAHFLSRGHRNFMILVFDRPSPSTIRDSFSSIHVQRMNGYKQAFSEFGVEFPIDRIVSADTSIESGARAFREAWEAGMRPGAVLSFGDVMAMGVLREAHRMGIRVPQDMEIIGFDNVPECELVQPTLSTVAQPSVEKGKRAAELVIASLNSETGVTPEKVFYETQLILRGTTI